MLLLTITLPRTDTVPVSQSKLSEFVYSHLVGEAPTTEDSPKACKKFTITRSRPNKKWRGHVSMVYTGTAVWKLSAGEFLKVQFVCYATLTLTSVSVPINAIVTPLSKKPFDSILVCSCKKIKRVSWRGTVPPQVTNYSVSVARSSTTSVALDDTSRPRWSHKLRSCNSQKCILSFVKLFMGNFILQDFCVRKAHDSRLCALRT